jgi:hypothetical protein
MIQTVIFSFNQALQLDALLSSLLKEWKAPSCRIDVIYNSSNDFFQQGYNRLIEKFSSDIRISFRKEQQKADKYGLLEFCSSIQNLRNYIKRPCIRKPKTNFRSELIRLLENSSSKIIMFLTDDSCFIRPVNIKTEIINFVENNPEKANFSLRIGKYMNTPPSNIASDGEYLSWNYFDCDKTTNWGYVFSVDGHLYDKKYVLKSFKRLIFLNPNTLEGAVVRYARAKKWFGKGMSNEYASLLSFPINMVQTISNNESLGVSVDFLNEKYLEGYGLEYPVPDNIVAFQQYPSCLTLRRGNEIVKYKTHGIVRQLSIKQ